MTLRSGIIGVTFFVSACGGGQPPATPELGLPAWDGAQIVCNETVSFARAATEALPEFEPNERLGLCARSMRYIELNRQFGDQSSYFGVAAATTASLAATYAPLVRRAYSASTWEFMDNLSADIELRVNMAAENAAGSQRVLGRFTRARMDTGALIREEQKDVQTVLEAFARDNPEAYAQLIEDVNGTFNPTNRLLIAAINRNPFFKAYEAGLAQVRLRHGGAIDFAVLEQRIEIGEVLQALIEGIPPE
ncbi:MAG: hypothetical protein GQ535_02250 [Rhodobacteraceae bacterium]|nr:hypothetical protein [Paracoccaceae bacterium]